MYILHAKNYDKWSRAEEAAKAFIHFNITWTEHNNGMHWKFWYEGIEYNYYPTTGKWFTVSPKHSCTNAERFLGGLLHTLGFKFKEV